MPEKNNITYKEISFKNMNELTTRLIEEIYNLNPLINKKNMPVKDYIPDLLADFKKEYGLNYF